MGENKIPINRSLKFVLFYNWEQTKQDKKRGKKAKDTMTKSLVGSAKEAEVIEMMDQAVKTES